MTNKAEGMTLALGESRPASSWRIIQTEALGNGAVMVTLKSFSAFAIIPAIDYGQVAPKHRPAVDEAIDSVGRRKRALYAFNL